MTDDNTTLRFRRTAVQMLVAFLMVTTTALMFSSVGPVGAAAATPGDNTQFQQTGDAEPGTAVTVESTAAVGDSVAVGDGAAVGATPILVGASHLAGWSCVGSALDIRSTVQREAKKIAAASMLGPKAATARLAISTGIKAATVAKTIYTCMQ